jgi:hypothetical protein
MVAKYVWLIVIINEALELGKKKKIIYEDRL